MSLIIEKLLLQIAYVCLHITAQGRWHAHYTLSAHVRAVNVTVLPADTLYVEGSPRVRALDRTVWYHDGPFLSALWRETTTQEAPLALERLLSDLEAFLDLEQMMPAAAVPPSINGTPPSPGGLDEVSVSTITGLALAGGQAELLLTTRKQEVRVDLTAERIDVPEGYALDCLLVAHGQRHTLRLSPRDGLYAARLCEWVASIATGTAAAA